MVSKIHDITFDRYNNEIERIINFKGNYRKIRRQYNDNNKLTLCIEYDSNENILLRKDIKYDYDLHGNVVSIIEKNKFKYFPNIVETKYEYENIYIDNKLMSKTKYENNKLVKLIQFTYNGGYLTKSIETFYTNEKINKYIHIYTYLNNKNDVIEHIWLGSGVVSCRIRYEKLDDGKIRHTVLDPWSGKYSWRISEINNQECFVDILENVLFPDLLKEICECLIASFSGIKSLILNLEGSEDITYCKEIIEMEDDYRDKIGINICRIM